MSKTAQSSNHGPRETRSAPVPRPLAETGRGVSFIVDFQEGPKPSKAEKRRHRLEAKIANRSEEISRSETKLVQYTDDESMLIAEIMRGAHIEEKKNKARDVDIKIYDASRRRKCNEYVKEQVAEQKATHRSTATVDAAERRRRVKEMAEASRKRAAVERSVTAT